MLGADDFANFEEFKRNLTELEPISSAGWRKEIKLFG
jgi:hypothetical protein